MIIRDVSLFLVERCSGIAEFCLFHKISSVCHLYRECIVTKQLQIRSCGFHFRVAKGLIC